MAEPTIPSGHPEGFHDAFARLHRCFEADMRKWQAGKSIARTVRSTPPLKTAGWALLSSRLALRAARRRVLGLLCRRRYSSIRSMTNSHGAQTRVYRRDDGGRPSGSAIHLPGSQRRRVPGPFLRQNPSRLGILEMTVRPWEGPNPCSVRVAPESPVPVCRAIGGDCQPKRCSPTSLVTHNAWLKRLYHSCKVPRGMPSPAAETSQQDHAWGKGPPR